MRVAAIGVTREAVRGDDQGQPSIVVGGSKGVLEKGVSSQPAGAKDSFRVRV